MDTILTVKDHHLTQLSPVGSVEVFRELLYAEATRISVPVKNINVSSWVNVADGGIDASIHAETISDQESFVLTGLNCYQIKAGQNFSPWQPSEIEKELFGKKPPERQNLGESVRHCLENHGTYGLICFGTDLNEKYQIKARGLLDSYFKACGYQEFKVEVWGCNNLISFLRPFPSLALRVNGNHKGMFETYAMWASHADMDLEFVSGDKQEHLIASIRAELLRQDDQPLQLHIWGEPGIGKTRLALEATHTDDLRPLVVYSTADNFNNSELLSLVQQGAYHAILVLDDCDSRNRQAIWNRLKCHSPRIKLVSLHDEPVQNAGLPSFKVPPLEEPQTSVIIQSYISSEIRASHWAGVCEGSPKVAHIIGQQVKLDSGNILQSLNDIWEDYVVGSDDRHSLKVEQRWRVLRFLALFKRFGYGRPVTDEAEIIWTLIHQADQTITSAIFQEVVHYLRTRTHKILQGTYTLHITPKLLHVKLWIDWWDLYGERFPLDTLFGLPESLREWAFEMFEYAGASEAASRCAEELLGKRGIFQQNPQMFKTEPGAKLFEALAKAEPEAALRCLQNTIGTWSKEELSSFTTGQISVVWALEDIAVRKNLFVDAARLLLALAEVEDDQRSGHASGIFVGLFYISLYPEFSRTEATPQERFPVLQEAFESISKRRRLLALWACNRALHQYWAGIVLETESVVGERFQLWKPETYGDLFDSYRQVWQYMAHNLEHLSDDERQEACKILIENACQIARIPGLTNMVIDTISTLAKKSYTDKENILKHVLGILRREDLSDETRQRWEKIKQEFTGTGFSSLLKRYVGMSIFEDRFDGEGKQTDFVQQKIEELAQHAMTHQELLLSELQWLATTEAKKGFHFGYALGKRDRTCSLLPTLIQTQQDVKENECTAFLGGYLRVLFERNYHQWECFLERLAENTTLNAWVPELTWRSGRINNASALRILELVKTQIVDIRQLPIYTQGVQELSEDIITTWIELLLSHPDKSTADVAFNLYHDYYLEEPQKRLPEELTLALLTHHSVFQEIRKFKHDPSFGHFWESITKAFIQQYPSQRGGIADLIFEHFGKDMPIFGDIFSPAGGVLLEMIRQSPEKIWTRVAACLESPRDRRTHQLEYWLKGYDFPGQNMGSGAILPMFPMQIVWQWIDKNIEERAAYFARFIPKEFFRDEPHPCWACEFLVRYGSDTSVRKRLLESFWHSYAWSGSRSAYFQNKKQELLDFKHNEKNSNIRQWLDEYISTLDYDIECATITEERRGF